MNAFLERINSAPTHLAYFTRGGGNVLIAQTMGEVVREDEDYVTILSAAGLRELTIDREDVIKRVDGGARITEAEWDEIFAERGHEQRIR